MLKFCLKSYIVVTSLAFLIFSSMKQALLIPINHSDGAFQTASAVLRISIGEIPGRDFLTYLGVGLNYIVSFLSILLGSSLTDTVTASHLIVFLSLWIMYFTILICVFPRQLFFNILTISGFLTVLSITVNAKFEIGIFHFISGPGNSLLPLRALLPYLLIIISYRIFLKPCYSSRDAILLGMTAGVGVLWSNDYAYTSPALFSVLFLVCLMLKNNNSKFKLIAIYSISALLSAIVYYILATGLSPLTMIRYNFFDVRPDQWWYFAPYSHNYRILGIRNFISVFSHINLIWMPILFAAFFTLGVTKKSTPLLILSFIGWALFLSGILTSVGGHYFTRYFWPCFFYIKILLICAVVFLIHFVIKQKLTAKYQKYAQLWIILLVAVVCSVITTKQCFSYIMNKHYYAQNTEKFYYYPPLEGYIETTWKPYLDFIEGNRKATVLEEYWGIWSSIALQKKSQRVDSCIHALGEEREKYISLIDSCDYVITTRNTVASYQNWRLSTNYEFYRKLLQAWTPIFKSPHTIVWSKSNVNRLTEKVPATISKGGQSLQIPCKEPSFYDVEIEVNTVYKSRGLFLFKNNICDKDIPNYVSLSPYKDRHFIIVYATPDSCEFDLKKIGGIDNSIKIVKVTARRISSLDPDLYVADKINIKEK